MSVSTLLQELESLTHQGRMARMVAVGRLARRDAATAAELDALMQGGVYERRLAVQACFGSQNGAQVLKGLGDPSRMVRSLAITLTSLVCDDTQVQAALEMLSAPDRQVILRSLARRRRQAPIDAFLEWLAGRGDAQFATLLAFGSTEVVARHLDQVLQQAGPVERKRLARYHARLVVQKLQHEAEATNEFDQRLLWLANTVLPIVIKQDPDQALSLVRALASHIPLAQLSIDLLAARRPNEIADLALTTGDRPSFAWDQVMQRLTTQQIIDLLSRRDIQISWGERWFRRLSPDQRAEIYKTYGTGWRDSEGRIDAASLALMPRDVRQAEGRRHWDLPVLATRPKERMMYAAFLPWAETQALLDPFLRSADAELRAAVWAALIYGIRFERSRLPELLTMIHARRNEQDPVRQAILTELRQMPPGMWRREHLDDLGQIIRDALNARDLSAETARNAEHLILVLLPFHLDWGVNWFSTLVREQGRVTFGDLSSRLSNADVQCIEPALLPVFHAWQTREREPYLIAAAQCLGKRLRVFSGLLDILERLIHDTRNGQVAVDALDLIAQHRRERLPVLIPELIRRDPSWVTRPLVYQYLHRYRQDLLTPFLGQQAYKGRFSTGKTRFVLPLVDGFHRWTSQQQAVFARTLEDLTGDTGRDTPALMFAVRQLAALAMVSPDRLIQLASDERQAVRETTVGVLGSLDAGQGVPVLLEAINDDRARIAIYALRRALLGMPADRALELLRAVPMAKVTVAKEVVRLIGDLKTEVAFQALMTQNRQELHRDVRVALLRALWNYLEHTDTWDIFDQAAHSPDSSMAAIVGRIPADRLSTDTQQRLLQLLVTLSRHPDPVVRLDVLKRCVELPVSDPEHRLIAPLLDAITSPLPDEADTAARAIFATYAGRDAQLMRMAVARIKSNRRVLWILTEALKRALQYQYRQLLPTSRAILDALRDDPLTASLRAELAVYILPWSELADFLVQLSDNHELHADVVAAVEVALDDVAREETSGMMWWRTSWYESGPSRIDADQLGLLESALADQQDACLRRIALAALVNLARPPRGWTEERIARLAAYRADPAPLVAAAAQFTFLPVEQGTHQD